MRKTMHRPNVSTPARRCAVILAVVFASFLTGCTDAPDDYADAMAEQHAHDTPAPSGAATEPAAPVVADTVRYATLGGLAVTGYMAAPVNTDSVLAARGLADASTLPAVIVIHEWWGLNDNVRAMTRRLAGEGYRALAVDLYGGRIAETPDSARVYTQAVMADPATADANLTAAYRFLTDRHAAPRVASLGWCFGGTMTLRAALALPDELDAAVIYYGHVTGATREELATLSMPIAGFFGGQDQSIPLDGVRAFEETLRSLGRDVEIHVYDDAGHAFANPSGQNYVEADAEDAWAKTTAFLEEHLYE